MTTCKDCGRVIEFIKSKKGGKIPVNARTDYFIPDEINGSDIYVTAKGEVRKGRLAADGVRGHLLHNCKRR